MKRIKKMVLAYSLAVTAFLLSVFAAYSYIDVESLKGLTMASSKVEYKGIPSKDNSFYVKQHDKTSPQDLNNPETQNMIKAQSFLLTKVDGRLKQLKPFTDIFEKMPAINEADKKSVVKELTSEIDKLAALKVDVNKSASKQDVRAVADKIKAEWLKSRASVDRAKGLMMVAKGNQMVADAKTASASIQKKINSLKASGKDVKPMEKFFHAYSEKVELAQKNADAIQTKSDAINNATSDTEKHKLTKEKAEQMELAQNNIKDAYHLIAQEARRDFASRMK